MPKHISETLLSACGCHTALVVHANICQVIVQTVDNSQFILKIYGTYINYLRVVFYFLNWQVTIERMSLSLEHLVCERM